MSRHQHGIALPIVLLLLLVMTILGVTSLNTTALEDQMSGNKRAREIAFNAAETVLRFGELHAERIKATSRTGGDFFVGFYPDSTIQHPGQTCDDGFCIPASYDLQNTGTSSAERWEDSALDVWNDGSKHHVYDDFAASNMDNEGVFEAPKYIIEYLGDFPILDPSTGDPILDNRCVPGDPAFVAQTTSYPFCPGSPALFRITARALAGSPGRETVVILQSTIRVP